MKQKPNLDMSLNQEARRARRWLLRGGCGHESGEDGLRAMSVSGYGLVEFLAVYARHLALTARQHGRKR